MILLGKTHYKSSDRGFTLVELVVVIAILGVLAAMSIAAFNGYNKSQQLTGAVQDIKSILILARSNAQSQVKPSSYCSANQQLNGYQVNICNGGGNPACKSSADYEMNVECNGTYSTITTGNFPANGGVVVLGTSTSKSFLFAPFTGTVTGNGRIDINAPGQSTQSITVQMNGVIQ